MPRLIHYDSEQQKNDKKYHAPILMPDFSKMGSLTEGDRTLCSRKAINSPATYLDLKAGASRMLIPIQQLRLGSRLSRKPPTGAKLAIEVL